MNNVNLLNGKRVLVVDDEPDVLESLEDMLSMCQLTKASTFNEAKRLLETEQFDLAVLDIMGVRGYELLDIAVNKNVLSIMLTAHALSPGSTAQSYEKGAAFYVPKEAMTDIPGFLKDVLEAKERGESSWSSWLQKFEEFYDTRFGSQWKEEHKDFWEELARLDWRLASAIRREEEND